MVSNRYLQEGLISMKSITRVVPREMASRPYCGMEVFFVFKKKVRRNKIGIIRFKRNSRTIS